MFKVGDIIIKTEHQRLGTVVEIDGCNILVDYGMSDWNCGHNGNNSKGKNYTSMWWETTKTISIFSKTNKLDFKELIINESKSTDRDDCKIKKYK